MESGRNLMEQEIKSGKARFLGNMSKRSSVWEVVLPGNKTVAALFNKESGIVSTLMPMKWVQKWFQ